MNRSCNLELNVVICTGHSSAFESLKKKGTCFFQHSAIRGPSNLTILDLERNLMGNMLPLSKLRAPHGLEAQPCPCGSAEWLRIKKDFDKEAERTGMKYGNSLNSLLSYIPLQPLQSSLFQLVIIFFHVCSVSLQ